MRFFLFALFLAAAGWMSGCKTVQAPPPQTGTARELYRESQDLSPLAVVVNTSSGLRVVLQDSFLFKANRSELTEAAVTKLDSIAAVLKNYPDNQVSVAAYEDSSGSKVRNMRISQRRAEAVQTELLQQGLPAGNVGAMGEGDENPVASNDTPEGREQNRRIEIDITIP
jgi:outer membrane protein OmpA-like peptidoglycan-associated protein